MSKVHWIKISTDIIHNRKIEGLRYVKQGNQIILLWFYLLVLAGQTNDKGSIYFTKSIPYTDDKLQRQFNIPKSVIREGLAYFKANDMITTDERGIIEIIGWEEYQNAEMLERIRESNRIRQQRFYNTQKTQSPIQSVIEQKPNAIPNAQPNAQPNDDLLDDIVVPPALDNRYSNRVDVDVEKKRKELDLELDKDLNMYARELVTNKILSESEALKLNEIMLETFKDRETSLLKLIAVLKNQSNTIAHTYDSVKQWVESFRKHRI